MARARQRIRAKGLGLRQGTWARARDKARDRLRDKG